jgi:hypothetical protein
MVKEHVETTRKLAPIRQIRGAISALHNGDYECAVTLAHAAEGMVPDKKPGDDRKPLIKLMCERMPDDDPNLFSNWLKKPERRRKGNDLRVRGRRNDLARHAQVRLVLRGIERPLRAVPRLGDFARAFAEADYCGSGLIGAISS